MLARVIVTLCLLGWTGPALASSLRIVEGGGVVYLTNTSRDSRLRQLSGSADASSGGLAIPEGFRRRYAREIADAAGRYGVDPALVRTVIWVESAFNPWAVSRKGARGLMQLMPQTASAVGVRDSFHPAQSIDGGVRYLRALIDRYGGDLPLALAAYNAGVQAVDWYGRIPPYPETEQYVHRILSLYGTGSHATPPRYLYRYEDWQGTLIYTNIPPGRSRNW